MQSDMPVFYSFRRCPYAIRARLAILAAQQQVELREISLKNKHAAFLRASPSGTVPCLVAQGSVIDESLEIMLWALQQNDPQGWLDMPTAGWALIAHFDGAFKVALDRTKYAVRYAGSDPESQRAIAHGILSELEAEMGAWIFERPSIADYAILPFVRQFAFIDKPLFDTQPWPKLHDCLGRFLGSAEFQEVMGKHAFWQVSDAPTPFPPLER
ncbi:glutathione S-transferase [Planktotalea arctica]|uniref:glutathione S-transferase n=1 Tax=Planktotalea arctica TaxID=1481893 RepID=UPI000A1763D6|nr:glutathione S-transferase [Planktotalea arctica]